ncbi:MAG: ribonuclease H-like domain-containing protein [Bacteroidetes bacterium]|nr:ribonuclease H-like domain-containing protein [Bacteroidota bacterium]MBU2507098.1 ribonuclease H-like domain-containing protein [Bacteroidota bacterium]
MKLVFDIETVGFDFEALSESQQEHLLRFAEKEKCEDDKVLKREEAIRYLSLYPFTASVAALAMLNVDTEQVIVFYCGEPSEEWKSEDKLITYKSIDEKELLQKFWSYADKAKQLITFNGRQFDIPFLMFRSAILKVKPTKNFIKNRYDTKSHLDLLDQLTLHGMIRKFNLDFYCHAFGIDSPKSHGVSGMDVKELFNSGRCKEIAIYCADDVKATYKLYKIWNEYLNLE